jgi:hypothetical protein
MLSLSLARSLSPGSCVHTCSSTYTYTHTPTLAQLHSYTHLGTNVRIHTTAQLLHVQVSDVSTCLRLDWRRHLGLLLWYHIRTTSPTSTPAYTTTTSTTRTTPATTPATGTSADPMLLPHQRAPATAAVDALRAYATTLLTQAHSRSEGRAEGREGDAPWPHPLYMEAQQLVCVYVFACVCVCRCAYVCV